MNAIATYVRHPAAGRLVLIFGFRVLGLLRGFRYLRHGGSKSPGAPSRQLG